MDSFKMMFSSDDRNYAQMHLRKIRQRAVELGIGFDLTIRDLLTLYRDANGAQCPVLGITMERSRKQGGSNSNMSLDRVIQEDGYTINNVRVICQRANRIKHEASVRELEAIVVYMKQHQILEQKRKRNLGRRIRRYELRLQAA